MSSVHDDNSTAISDEVGQGGAQNALIGGLAALALYGIFFVLFCITIHILCFRPKRYRTSRLLLVASLAIFVFTSIDVIIQCHRLLIGLLYTAQADMNTYFNGGGDWLFGLQDAIRVVNMLIGDAVLLYRAWVVWERRWIVVIFNILVWLGTLVASIRIVQLQVNWIQNPADFLILLDMSTWSIVAQSLTMAQTTTATGLIAFRLWKVDRAASTYKESSLLPIVRILVEAGALYTSFMLVNLVLTALINPVVYVILEVSSPIIGITFSLIIVRVGMGLSSESRISTAPLSTISHRSHAINVSIQRHTNSEGLPGDDERSAFEDGHESVKMTQLGTTVVSA